MNQYQVICIDSDEQFLRSMENSLPKRVSSLCPDFQCVFEFVASSDELSEVVSQTPENISLAMLISDQMMAGVSGIELIGQLKCDHPDMVSILLTGHSGLDTARYAINSHLLDQYIPKPIEDIQSFVSLVANLLKRFHLHRAESERTDQLANMVSKLRSCNEEISDMQTAAEEIASLSRDLRGLDFDAVVEVVQQQIPRIFKNQKATLCFPPSGICPHRQDFRNNGTTPDGQPAAGTAESPRKYISSQAAAVSTACEELTDQSPDITVPLYSTIYADTANSHDIGDQGYLCLCHMDKSADSSELLRYKAVLAGEIISTSLINAAQYQQARHDSLTDYLTGANSRRAFDEKLHREYERSVHCKHPLCVLIVDIDRFKNINDRSGHIAGDHILRELTNVIGKQMRKTDILARYGGDEFVVLMPKTILADAITAAERMRSNCESELTSKGHSVTISCGVAQWSGQVSESGIDVLRRADTALYKAKVAGRNNVQVGQAA